MKQGLIYVGAVVLAAVAGAGAMALWKSGAGTNRAEIEKITRETILNNPEILPEAMKNLERKTSAKAVTSNASSITTPYGNAWEGAPDADVTLVEFYDYACGYCRLAVADVEKLLANDKKLKVVYREMPVLGEQSVNIAAISLAAAKTPSFLAFHKAVYGGGDVDDATIDAALTKSGLNPADIRAKARSPEIAAELKKMQELQAKMNFGGTPTWVVGDRVINGAVGYDDLAAAIAEVRAAKS